MSPASALTPALDHTAPPKSRTKKWVALGAAAALIIGAGVATPFILQHTGVLDSDVGKIAASGEGVSVSVKSVSGDDSRFSAAHEASAVVVLADYLMLTPVEILADKDIPESGVDLRIELPSELPLGVEGVFTYFDEEDELWVPVETVVDGKVASATVDHLSLWSFVAVGSADVKGFRSLQDPLEWWGKEPVSSWIYRQAGLFLGHQAPEPKCGGGTQPAWLETHGAYGNPNLADNEQPVLVCYGEDPENPELVRIIAASNRSYGHRYSLAYGMNVQRRSSSFVDELMWTDFVRALDTIADSGFLNVRKFIPGTTELRFSVSREDIAAATRGGQNIVEFTKPEPEELVMSVLFSIVLDVVDDPLIGILGATAMFKDCDVENVAEEVVAATVKDCAAAFAEGADWHLGLENNLGRASKSLADAPGPSSPALAKELVSKKTSALFSRVVKKLMWVKFMNIGLMLIDYQGEKSFQADGTPFHYVSMTAAKKKITWDDINGTWCNASPRSNAAPTIGCTTIALPQTLNEISEGRLTFLNMEGECFLGDWAPVPETRGRGGAGMGFCPAGAADPPAWFEARTPRELGSDILRDRVFDFGSAGGATDVSFRQ